MEIEEFKKILETQWKRTGLAVAKHTPVVSPLYPGNFCYCLNEMEVYGKYGGFIDIGEEHYQKMQPAIRIADFHRLGIVQGDHLGQFSIATINGFNSVPANKGKEQYQKSVQNMIPYLVSLGLDQSKLAISYFSGNDVRSIEASRKKDEKQRKVRFEKYVHSDELKSVLIENGINESQLIANNTRDNYLTSVWYACEAPWGYRNEIFYKLPTGRLLDIGTIERLVAKPKIEKEFFQDRKGYDGVATAVFDWEMNIVVDAVGIERVIQAVEGKDSIFQIAVYKPFMELGHSPEVLEAVKIAHRVFSDTAFKDLSRNRKPVIRHVLRTLNNLDSSSIERILETNAKVYASIYPELSGTVQKTLEEILAYRKRRE